MSSSAATGAEVEIEGAELEVVLTLPFIAYLEHEDPLTF